MRRKDSLLIKAMLTAGALFAVMPALSVSAENTYTPVSGEKITIEKYLIYASTSNAPEVTFTYNMTPGDAIPPEGGKYEVKSGGDPSVAGTPVIGSASFDSESIKYSTAQSTSSDIGQYAGITVDPVELSDNDVYSRSDISVDLSGVSFSKPGIFRWKITENDAGEQANRGVVPVGEQTKYLDVYVSSDSYNEGSAHGTLEITGYILQNKEGYQPPLEEGDDVTKTVGFTSRYSTHNISLRNKISGNQGSLNKYFEYTWNITGAHQNCKYDITYINADRVVPDKPTDKVTKAEYRGKENPVSVTTDSDGNATFKVYLKADQKISINGISDKAKITITQTQEEGYYVEHEASPREPGNSVYIDSLLTERNVTFYNEKKGAIPTGVIQNIIPGMLVVITALAGIYIMTRLKEETD